MKDFSNMKNASPILFCLALFFSACDKCDECASKFDFQFKFIDTDNNEIFTDLFELQVLDLNGTPFQVSRILQDEDTVYTVDLIYEDPLLDPPDTIVINYGDNIIDTVVVDISFTNDSDCCDHVFQIGSVEFLNRTVNRLIRPSGNVYRIIIE